MRERKNLNGILQLSSEQKKEITEEIVAFYLDIRGQEMGIIEQQQIMDLFVEKLAPIVYNRALDDAAMWYKRQQENMEADFYSLYRNIR